MIGTLIFGSLAIALIFIGWRLVDEVERLGRIAESDDGEC